MPSEGGPRLRRSIGIPGLVLYGLGTTIGAGVYALMGVIAAKAGTHAPIAFALASTIAAFSAASFAELSARFPRAGGEAVYVLNGLGSARLAQLVGLLAALAGIVSAATVCRAFGGTLLELLGVSRVLTTLAGVVVIGAIAAWGIRESVAAASLMTLLEAGGLLLIVASAGDAWLSLPERIPELWPSDLPAWSGVGSAAVLCFFAFLGFEDMVNVAEEVRDVRRALPLAIGLTLLITVGLYVVTAIAAVLSVPLEALAASEAPLVFVFEHNGGSRALLGWIALLAMLNGALVQTVKSSRVIYGLADVGVLTPHLASIHPRTRTPVRATACIVLLVSLLATSVPLGLLAIGTSAVTLAIFALTNLSLIRLHAIGPPATGFSVPRWVPVIGLALTLVLAAAEVATRVAG